MSTLTLSPSTSYTPPEQYQGFPPRPEDKVSRIGDRMTGTLVINQKSAGELFNYSIHLQNSEETANAGHALFSQGTSYGMSVGVYDGNGSNAYAKFQWVAVSDGTLLTNPLTVSYNGVAIGGPFSGTSSLRVLQNDKDTGVSIKAATSGTASGSAVLRFLDNTNENERFRISSSSNTEASIIFPSTFNIVSNGTTSFSVTGTTSTFSSTAAPSQTNTYDLGDGSLRWRNVYANNVSLSAGIITYAVTDVPVDVVDCSVGNYFTNTANDPRSFTFTNAPSAGNAYQFTLEITHTNGTISFPASVTWPGGTAPTLATNCLHIFTFNTIDGGVKWRGSYLNNYPI